MFCKILVKIVPATAVRLREWVAKIEVVNFIAEIKVWWNRVLSGIYRY